MENLTRGVVAVRRPDGSVYIGWRLFGTDPEEIGFHVYRREAGAKAVRITPHPVRNATNMLDPDPGETEELLYFVRPVLDGKELAPSSPVRVWERPYLEIPIEPVPGYRPGDASVGDLDGDGEYEIVLHQVSRPHDNAHSGVTGRPILDAYEFDGRRLWRIDLGVNIREGEHYTQFMVYDLDGDGRAELACKTADGTIDGRGRASGAALKTVPYVPGRDPIDGWGGIGGNGGNDVCGNRCDRFLACIAYLDGERPSLVMCRGVYGRTVVAAWDWRGGELSRRWAFDSGISYPPYEDASPYSGMGGHSIAAGDVDGDGRDEIVYQAMVVDDDGKGLYSTRLRHGDAMHLGDLDPTRPGLEVFTVQETEGATVRFGTPGAAMRDAATGKILWSHSPGVDVAFGMAADIDPRYPGCEVWGGPGGLRTARGEPIGPAPRTRKWALWWDEDLLRELFHGRTIYKWNPAAGAEEPLFDLEMHPRVRQPALVADLIGDWREEILVADPGGRSLRLYTTTTLTEHRLPTLMHDPLYRLAVAAQNVAYNLLPHPSFFLGHGMKRPPRPEIRLVGKGEALFRSAPRRRGRRADKIKMRSDPKSPAGKGKAAGTGARGSRARPGETDSGQLPERGPSPVEPRAGISPIPAGIRASGGPHRRAPARASFVLHPS